MLNADSVLFNLNEASSGAKTLSSILDNVCSESKEKLIQAISEQFITLAKNFLKMAKESSDFNYMSWRQKNKDAKYLELIQKSSIPNSLKFDKDEAKLIDGYKELSDKMAKRITDKILSDYNLKVRSKIESVLSGNENYSVVLNYLDLNGSAITSSMTFKLNSGGMFTIRTQIVYVFNQNMTQFVRYPLTFHDVYLPSGEKMKSPSEAKIKKEFK